MWFWSKDHPSANSVGHRSASCIGTVTSAAATGPSTTPLSPRRRQKSPSFNSMAAPHWPHSLIAIDVFNPPHGTRLSVIPFCASKTENAFYIAKWGCGTCFFPLLPRASVIPALLGSKALLSYLGGCPRWLICYYGQFIDWSSSLASTPDVRWMCVPDEYPTRTPDRHVWLCFGYLHEIKSPPFFTTLFSHCPHPFFENVRSAKLCNYVVTVITAFMAFERKNTRT